MTLLITQEGIFYDKEDLAQRQGSNFQRCWLPVSRIGLHRRGVERVNCGPKLLDLGEKGVYSSYTLSAAGQKGIRPCPSR
ncbi:hypothetical protein GO845_00220 [Acinetobacter baumannii]|nr:hypothetical protein [Acinetobacter baumannii]